MINTKCLKIISFTLHVPYFFYFKCPAHFSGPVYIDGMKKRKHPKVFHEIEFISWYQTAHCANVHYVFVMP